MGSQRDGVLRDACDGRRLDRGEVRGGLREVQLRGGLGTIGVRAELRDVEVLLDHLLLAAIDGKVLGVAFDPVLVVEVLLESESESPLADLAGQGDLGRGLLGLLVLVRDRLLEEGVLHELLRERRGAGRVGRREVDVGGAQQALSVDAMVLPEALVLDRHHGLLQPGRDLLEWHDHTVLRVERREQVLAGAVVDVRLLRQAHRAQLLRQLLEELGRALGGGARDRHRRQRKACDQEAAHDRQHHKERECRDQLDEGHLRAGASGGPRHATTLSQPRAGRYRGEVRGRAR